jgi:glycosyltransferase involved in cell wall biosynthesis
LGDIDKAQRIMHQTNRSLTVQDKFIKQDIRSNVALIKKCDQLICVAQHSVDSFTQLNCLGKTPTVVVNNALKDIYQPLSKPQKQELRKKYHIDADTNVILFAGRIDPVKGVPSLIQAFELVLQTYPDSRLLIAGDGDFGQCINVTHNCWSKVSFTGKLPKQELYELYSIADAGAVCSLHEEFGYVAIEMMMYALPLVVTDTTGLAEIVIDEETGLKVPINNVDGNRMVDVERLAEQINRLLDDRDWAQTLGKAGRERFLEKYKLNLFKAKILDVYNV